MVEDETKQYLWSYARRGDQGDKTRSYSLCVTWKNVEGETRTNPTQEKNNNKPLAVTGH